MEGNGFGDYSARLASLKERYTEFVTELTELRNRFFADFPMVRHIGDAQWVEIYWQIHELWEASAQEDSPALSKKHASGGAGHEGQGGSDAVCSVCGFPLSGRQRLYCSESCKKKAARGAKLPRG